MSAASDSSAFKAEYVGGTLPSIAPNTGVKATFPKGEGLVLAYGKEATVRIPCEKVVALEYGQNVSRRVAAAVLISPMFLLSKSRKHYITLNFTDGEDRPQVVVLRVGKGEIRTALAILETRTGRRVEYQDDNARKAGR